MANDCNMHMNIENIYIANWDRYRDHTNYITTNKRKIEMDRK